MSLHTTVIDGFHMEGELTMAFGLYKQIKDAFFKRNLYPFRLNQLIFAESNFAV
jgi:hypothetical protein